MHPGSMENMKLIRKRHLAYLEGQHNLKVLDVGGLHDVPKKSYLRIFEDLIDIEWTVCDIVTHPSVDVVMPDPFTMPFPDSTFDLVVSGQMLEHCLNPFKSVAEMKRVLKPKCRLAIIAPSSGPRHDPKDAWRFYDDAFQFIIQDVGGIKSIADWIQRDAPDERSRKWQDHMFVGEKLNV